MMKDFRGRSTFKEVENSPELQLRIYREICRNVWYYLRSSTYSCRWCEIMYELNIANATMAFLKLLNRNIIEIICRQHGKTMSNIVFDSWSFFYLLQRTLTMHILTKGRRCKEELKDISKTLRSALPKWLN